MNKLDSLVIIVYAWLNSISKWVKTKLKINQASESIASRRSYTILSLGR